MVIDVAEYSVTFPDGYDDRAALETPAKGHLQGVEVRLRDGTAVPLTFYDPVRLQQTLDDDTADGRPYFSAPGLVVVPEVTTDAVLEAVAGLYLDGYFR
ncbi:MAG: hypothetical protein ACRC33_29815 [Gemmataceae bacterium]